MAAPTTTDLWDEYVAKVVATDIAPVDAFTVGLYRDSVDTIEATDDMAAITTQPDGAGGYTTNAVSMGASATVVLGADATIQFPNQTFAGLNYVAETWVDAFFISATVQLDGDAGPTEHLMAVGTLDGGPYDLQNYPSFTVDLPSIVQTQGV